MKQLTIPGFTTNTQPEDTFTVAIYGLPSTGKTRFIATAPDPIGLLPLERKSRPTIHKVATELGKVVVLPEQDFIRVANPMKTAMMNDTQLMTYYRQHVDAIKRAGYELVAHPDVRTIGIDSGSQLFEDMMFANYGRTNRIMQRDRGLVNQEYTQFINTLSEKNLIITHHAKELYKNDRAVPGKYVLAGYNRTGHLANVVCEMVIGDDGEFGLHVDRCQFNPELQGPGGRELLTGEAVCWDMLATAIDPDWEEKTRLASERRMVKAFKGVVK